MVKNIRPMDEARQKKLSVRRETEKLKQCYGRARNNNFPIK